MNHLRTLLAATTTWANWLVDQARLSHAAIVTWHRRLVAAQHYHGQHRPGVQRRPLLHWADAQRARVQQWLDTEPPPKLALDDTQSMILPNFDDPNFDLAHYQLSGGSAEYLRLKDAMLDAEIEAVFTRTETNPHRLPLRYEEYDDDMYAAVTR